MIVVVPDINVLVSKLYADKAAKSSTISQKVVLHLVSGSINGEPVQIAMSFKMLDTYREVLLRKEYPEALVEEEISALVDMMKFGPAGFDPHIVLGGSPDPALKDIEDGGVLATAYAAHAGILITDNLKDFAGQDAETYRTSRVEAPPRYSLVEPDTLAWDVGMPFAIPTSLWRPGFVYTSVTELVRRPGRERYDGGFRGAQAPVPLDSRSSATLFTLD